MNNILLVDDQPVNLKILFTMLKLEGYDVRAVTTGPMALKTVQEHQPPDLVLLDVMMPNMDGFTTCRRLKELPQMKDVPIIFISASDNYDDKMRAFEEGGVDYITKPFNANEVLARVHTHLELRRRRLEVEQLKQAEIDHLATINQLQNEMLRVVSHDFTFQGWPLAKAVTLRDDTEWVKGEHRLYLYRR